MSSKRPHVNSVVRCYEVGSPSRHRDGFTIYKVTEQIIHVDALENNIQETVTWKRYNDFNKLYKSMFLLHKALHRREEFPDFVRAKLFNRFDESVIEERRRSAQDLLNFLGQRHYLVASKAFKDFFEGAEAVETQSSTLDLLQPEKLYVSVSPDTETTSDDVSSVLASCDATKPGEGAVDSDSRTTSPTSDVDTEIKSVTLEADGAVLSSSHESLSEDHKCDDLGLFGGVWLHQLKGQEDTTSSGDGAEEDEVDTVEDAVVAFNAVGPANLNVLDVDISTFDSLQPESLGVEMTAKSNVELLSSIGDTVTAKATEDEVFGFENVLGNNSRLEDSAGNEVHDSIFYHPLTDSRLSSDDQVFSSKSDTTIPRTGSVIESGRGDLVASPVHHSAPSLSMPRIPSLLRVGASYAKSKLSLSWKSVNTTSGINDGQTEYIIEAAELISQAQEHEFTGSYQIAFSNYKSGIGILLKGVQKDSNPERREAVRMKTEKYLLKAEELYHKHLSASEELNAPNRWGIRTGFFETEVDAGVALLRAPSEELQSFKVIGIIHGVQLVVDMATEETYVVKALHKSCTDSLSHTVVSIVPTHLPYVVGLVKFYETESTVYLLLQHAAGGRLWSYVGSYLNQGVDTPQAVVPNSRILSDNNTEPENCDSESTGLFVDAHTAFYRASEEISSTSAIQFEKIPTQRIPSDSSLLLSTLSFSEVEGLKPTQYQTIDGEQNLISDSFSPKIDSSSMGFNSILKSATTEINCFSIGSFESTSTSRQTSCSSDVNPVVSTDVDCFESEENHLSSVPRDKTLTDVVGETHPTCSIDDEISIYDKYRPSTIISFDNLSNDEILSYAENENGKENVEDVDSLGQAEERSSVALANGFVDEQSKRCLSISRLKLHDRSFETAGRKRLRTLSSTFGDLDLAGVCNDTSSYQSINRRLPEGCVCQWAAEMVVAITRLHSTGIICRDLSPANILLGDRGHILLTYFSQWNTVDRTLSEHAVNNLYCAPEVTGVLPLSPSCDWWSLGALLFELLTGQSLRSRHPAGIMPHTTIMIPDDLSCEAQSLLRELLRFNACERLGGGLGGSDEVRNHPFFAGIQWNNLLG